MQFFAIILCFESFFPVVILSSKRKKSLKYYNIKYNLSIYCYNSNIFYKINIIKLNIKEIINKSDWILYV